MLRTLRRAPAAPTRSPNTLPPRARTSPATRNTLSSMDFPGAAVSRVCPAAMPSAATPFTTAPPAAMPLAATPSAVTPFSTRLRRLPLPSSNCPCHDAVHRVVVTRRGLPRAAEHQVTCPCGAPCTDAAHRTVVADSFFARAAAAHAAVLACPSRPTRCHPSRGRGPRVIPSHRYVLPVAAPSFARP